MTIPMVAEDDWTSAVNAVEIRIPDEGIGDVLHEIDEGLDSS